MSDVDVIRLFLESKGAPSGLRDAVQFREANGTRPGFKGFLKRERDSQGMDQERGIAKSVSNACAQMFMRRPRKGNHFQTLWRVACLRAVSRAGLRPNLDIGAITGGTLRKVARILDALFCKGTLLEYISRKSGRPLRFRVDDRANRDVPDGAMYSDSGTNSIVLVREVWSRRMPRVTYMDGVRVRNKLEWLCHMMGHELCHALANAACGPTCAKKARNHGKVFKRLNHTIFGHAGDARRRLT